MIQERFKSWKVYRDQERHEALARREKDRQRREENKLRKQARAAQKHESSSR